MAEGAASTTEVRVSLEIGQVDGSTILRSLQMASVPTADVPIDAEWDLIGRALDETMAKVREEIGAQLADLKTQLQAKQARDG